MKKEDKFHCYSNKQIFNIETCSKDGCKWFIPCKVLCGNKIDIFSYILAGQLLTILPVSEVIDILMKNYGISHNAGKMAIKRYRKKK